MNIGEPVTFSFNCIGEITQQSYPGDFTVKPILGFGSIAAVDVERRRFIGNPDNESTVPDEIRSIAAMLAQLKFRIVKCPAWVIETNYLADMVDGNVLVELFKKVIEVEDQYRANLTKKADAALVEMKANA